MKVLLSDISFSKHFARCWHIWVTVFKSNLWMANPLIYFFSWNCTFKHFTLSFSDPKAFGWCWADIALRGEGLRCSHGDRPVCALFFLFSPAGQGPALATCVPGFHAKRAGRVSVPCLLSLHAGAWSQRHSWSIPQSLAEDDTSCRERP